MCQLLGVHRSLVYRRAGRLARPPLLGCLERLVTTFLGYGYRRVHRALVRQGVEVSEYWVRKTMRQEGLQARRPRSRGITRARVLDRRAANLLKGLKPTRPDEVWAGDTTLIRTASGPVYLAGLIDVFTRRVVAWRLSRRNDAALTLACLNQALESRRPQAGWIHHSDQGSAYTAEVYVKRIRDAGGRLSLSKPGTPQENAYAESFFRTLKLEEVDRNHYETFLEAEAALESYIDDIYNNRRMHSSLGYLSPDEFENRFAGGADN